jgi:hypothetical protein
MGVLDALIWQHSLVRPRQCRRNLADPVKLVDFSRLVVVPPDLIGHPRVSQSTVPNQRRHRWNDTSA